MELNIIEQQEQKDDIYWLNKIEEVLDIEFTSKQLDIILSEYGVYHSDRCVGNTLSLCVDLIIKCLTSKKPITICYLTNSIYSIKYVVNTIENIIRKLNRTLDYPIDYVRHNNFSLYIDFTNVNIITTSMIENNHYLLYGYLLIDDIRTDFISCHNLVLSITNIKQIYTMDSIEKLKSINDYSLTGRGELWLN